MSSNLLFRSKSIFRTSTAAVAAAIALTSMIDLIAARTGLSRAEAYMLCSLAADVRITQVVNGNKGVHVMLDKRYLKGRG